MASFFNGSIFELVIGCRMHLVSPCHSRGLSFVSSISRSVSRRLLQRNSWPHRPRREEARSRSREHRYGYDDERDSRERRTTREAERGRYETRPPSRERGRSSNDVHEGQRRYRSRSQDRDMQRDTSSRGLVPASDSGGIRRITDLTENCVIYCSSKAAEYLKNMHDIGNIQPGEYMLSVGGSMEKIFVEQKKTEDFAVSTSITSLTPITVVTEPRAFKKKKASAEKPTVKTTVTEEVALFNLIEYFSDKVELEEVKAIFQDGIDAQKKFVLSKLKIDDIRDLCKDEGMDASGRKEDLFERAINFIRGIESVKS